MEGDEEEEVVEGEKVEEGFVEEEMIEEDRFWGDVEDEAVDNELIGIVLVLEEIGGVVELEEAGLQPSNALQTSTAPAPILPVKLGLLV